MIHGDRHAASLVSLRWLEQIEEIDENEREMTKDCSREMILRELLRLR
jgi:hypothetical protein